MSLGDVGRARSGTTTHCGTTTICGTAQRCGTGPKMWNTGKISNTGMLVKRVVVDNTDNGINNVDNERHPCGK